MSARASMSMLLTMLFFVSADFISKMADSQAHAECLRKPICLLPFTVLLFVQLSVEVFTELCSNISTNVRMAIVLFQMKTACFLCKMSMPGGCCGEHALLPRHRN